MGKRRVDLLKVLNDREYAVYAGRQLAKPQKTLQELADQFGLSRERIRQIEKKASIKMARALGENDGLVISSAAPIDALGLMSGRLANCLRNEGFVTIRDIINTTENDLFRIPNFGRVSLMELKGLLKKHGFALASDPIASIERRIQTSSSPLAELFCTLDREDLLRRCTPAERTYLARSYDQERPLLLTDPIDALESLSGRVRHALYKNGLKTIGDVANKSEAELLRFADLGRAYVAELMKALEKHGLRTLWWKNMPPQTALRILAARLCADDARLVLDAATAIEAACGELVEQENALNGLLDTCDHVVVPELEYALKVLSDSAMQ